MKALLTGVLLAALFLCTFAYFLGAEGQSVGYAIAAVLVSALLGGVRS